MASNGLNKFMKEQQAQQQKALKGNPELQQQVASTQQQQELQQLTAQLQQERELRAQAERERDKAVSQSTSLKKHMDAQQSQAELDAVDAIIQDKVDTFKKHYKFSITGKPDIEFDVELRPASAEDLRQIDVDMVRQTDGMATMLPDADVQFFTALSVLKQVGVKVPEELKDPKKVYRLDIPLAVYKDYEEWLESFRQQVQY